MRAPAIALVLVLVAAVSFFFGRSTASSTARAPVSRTADRPESIEYQTRIDRLTEERDTARADLANARTQIAELQTTPPAQAEEPSETAPAVDSHAPRFVYDEQAELLETVDWKVVGESTAHLQPILGKLTTAIRDGVDLTTMTEEIGSIQRWNGPLVTQALKMRNSGLSGTAVNGAFTHPSIIVNQVYATLREANQPLTAPQEETLKDLGTRFIGAEAQRVAGYGDETPAARQTLEEARLKEDLYRRIDEMLTSEQREALHPADVRGIMKADLFSSGIIWLQVTRPMVVRNRDDLATRLVPEIMHGEKLPETHTELVRGIVTEWVAALPDAVVDKPYSPEVSHGFLRVTDVIASAEHCLKLRERLIQALPDESARAKVRAGAGVIVPYRRSE